MKLISRPPLSNSVYKTLRLQPHSQTQVLAPLLNTTIVKYDREMVCTKTRQTLLTNIQKVSFPLQGDEKMIQPRPQMAIRPREALTHEREIHQTQIEYQLREVLHSRVQPTLTGSFTGKTYDIKVPTKAPRNVPPTM